MITLKNFIKNYKYTNMKKVIIGRDEQIGLITQKTHVDPIFFYSCTVFGSFTKYRVIPDFNDYHYSFDLINLETFKNDDVENHHYNWLKTTCRNLKNESCLDMRHINVDTFAKELTNNSMSIEHSSNEYLAYDNEEYKLADAISNLISKSDAKLSSLAIPHTVEKSLKLLNLTETQIAFNTEGWDQYYKVYSKQGVDNEYKEGINCGNVQLFISGSMYYGTVDITVKPL